MVHEYKYLGSVIQNNERCTRKGKKRVKPGWKWWRRVVYKMVARSAMMCGLTKRQAAEVAELKIFIRSNQNGQD